MGIFGKATKQKLRFTLKEHTGGGVISTEDLWDLPLVSKNKANLDDMAIALNKQIQDQGVESFVGVPKKENEQTKLKFEVVKKIIEVKLAEKEAREKASENKEKKEQIMRLIADKKNDELGSKPIKELEKMLNNL